MGGGEINLELIAKVLAKDGAEVSILTSYHEGLDKVETTEGVLIHRSLKTGDNPSGLMENVKRSFVFPKSVENEVKKILKQQKIDVIHFIGTSIIAAPGLKNCGVPLFATIESYPTLCPKGDRIFHGKSECKIQCSFTKFLSCQAESPEIGKMKNEWYFKYNALTLSYIYNYYKRLNDSLQYCNLVSISEYVQDLLSQQGHDSTVIPNALPVEKFKRAWKKIENKPRNNKTKILYLGSLIRSKGPQLLLDAVEGLDIECELYGEGVLKEELQARIQEYSLPVKILSPLPYAEIPSLYAKADIVVFPSLWPEPFGRIAIEAMAAGKPVIGSAIGGIKETITGGTGILVDPGNVKQLREAIVLLIHDQVLRKEMGKKGRKMAEELYAEDRVVKKLLNLYQSKALSYPNKP